MVRGIDAPAAGANRKGAATPDRGSLRTPGTFGDEPSSMDELDAERTALRLRGCRGRARQDQLAEHAFDVLPAVTGRELHAGESDDVVPAVRTRSPGDVP